MKARVHQKKLSRLRRYHGPSFDDWLKQNVGKQNVDWGRIYDVDFNSKTFGTTWWFRDETKATLTLLCWG